MASLRSLLLLAAVCLALLALLASPADARPMRLRVGDAPPHSREEAAKLASLQLHAPAVDRLKFLSPVAGSTLIVGGAYTAKFEGGDRDWSVILSIIDVDRWAAVASLTARPIPGAAGQFVFTVPAHLNTSSTFQLYVQDVNFRDWTYGPVWSVTADREFRLTSPAPKSVFQRGSVVAIEWEGGLPQWQVNLSLINVTGWNAHQSLGQTSNAAQSAFFTLPLSLDCNSEWEFYIAEASNAAWRYGMPFGITGCDE